MHAPKHPFRAASKISPRGRGHFLLVTTYLLLLVLDCTKWEGDRSCALFLQLAQALQR